MKKIVLISFLLFSFGMKAQDSVGRNKPSEKDGNLPKGNAAFAEKQFSDAEADYRISQSRFSRSAKPSYNLGNAIYRQKQASEAKYQFAKAIKNARAKPERHQAFHNLGNCLMSEKDYQGAVEAYKNALRNNPQDEQTRYNYALAKLYLKNNPPKKDGKDKDKKQDKKEDKKKDQDQKDKKDNPDKDKDKGEDPQDKDKPGQNDKNKKDDNNQGQPKQNPGGMSKQRIESLLDAVNNEEKKVQDKVNLQKAKANPKKADKDW